MESIIFGRNPLFVGPFLKKNHWFLCFLWFSGWFSGCRWGGFSTTDFQSFWRWRVRLPLGRPLGGSIARLQAGIHGGTPASHPSDNNDFGCDFVDSASWLIVLFIDVVDLVSIYWLVRRFGFGWWFIVMHIYIEVCRCMWTWWVASENSKHRSGLYRWIKTTNESLIYLLAYIFNLLTYMLRLKLLYYLLTLLTYLTQFT